MRKVGKKGREEGCTGRKEGGKRKKARREKK